MIGKCVFGAFPNKLAAAFGTAPLKTHSKFLILRDRPTAPSSLWEGRPDGRGLETRDRAATVWERLYWPT